MHLPAVGENTFTHIRNDAGQLIRADMGMRLHENVVHGPETHQQLENALHITPFGSPGVQLAVGVGTCAPLAEAVVRVLVNDMVYVDGFQVLNAGFYILAPLQNHGFESELEHAQRREESGRTGADNEHFRLAGNVGVVGQFEPIGAHRLRSHTHPPSDSRAPVGFGHRSSDEAPPHG